MAINPALEFAGQQQPKTKLTSFKYGNAPAFPVPAVNPAFNLRQEIADTEVIWGPLKNWTEEQKNKFWERRQQLTSPSAQIESAAAGPLATLLNQSAWSQSKEGKEWELQKYNEMAREKAKQSLLFGTLARLPETMAAAVNPYGGPVGSAMAYQGMAAIPGIYSQTMAAFPGIQVPGYSAQQYRYF